MNSSAQNIIINTSQYTPIYVIQTPNISQAKSFVLSHTNTHDPNLVGNNLKSFYENSGKIANNLDENVEHKPNILRKIDSSKNGNNLKLAKFNLPSNDTSMHYFAPVNNTVLKPVVASSNTTKNVVDTFPKIDMNRKLVKIKDFPNSTITSHQTRKLPKTSGENAQNLTKHTSVQLLKLGETYHSLNELNDDQMKIVNQALKIFGDPESTPKEPAYDPVTNTQFIYKVLSPKDLTIVGKNNLIFTQKKTDVKKEFIKKENLDCNIFKKKSEKKEVKQVSLEVGAGQSIIRPVILETKVTRSGRKVKLPKHHSPEEETPHKPKKKNGTIVSCFQCSSEFSSLYRLQRHYEDHPTHIPAKVHSNLFHCLLAIIKSGSEEDRANIFIQQLEQLIAKMKSLLPCLLKKVDGNEGKLCSINDDIGRLFGMNPGKYNLNMDALSCVKDKEGHCRHNPAKNNQFNSDLGNCSQIWMKENEELSNRESEVDDCARINSVVKWPTVTKRNWKQKSQNSNAKKLKMEPEYDTANELEIDDLIAFSENDRADLKELSVPHIPNDLNNECTINENLDIFNELLKKPSHVQFRSAHFDIRSSPIKQSSTVFSKFQIDPEKIPKYEVQTIKPEGIENNLNDLQSSESLDTRTIFSDGIELPTKDVGEGSLDFENKDWALGVTNDQTECDIKSNTLIEPALLHIKDDSLSKNSIDVEHHNWHMSTQDNQNQSVFNFLESLGSDCLSYPATEIRSNTVDFQLDLY